MPSVILRNFVPKRMRQVEKSAGNNEGGSDSVPARFKSQFEAIIVLQANIGELGYSTLGNVFSLAVGASKAVTGPLKTDRMRKKRLRSLLRHLIRRGTSSNRQSCL